MEKETLYKFFANLASKAEKEAVKHWLEEDPSHQQWLLKERAFYDAMMLVDERKLTAAHRPVYSFRKLTQQTMKWAAVLLVAFISSYMFFNARQSSYDEATNTISVPPGQRVNLSLSDGTKVCLNAGSTFTYPALFAGNTRKVKLDGEAFFDVSANKEKPFIVHTDICDVEVLGTKFNVDAYKKEKTFSTALMEGKVKVKNNAQPLNVIYLSPNNKVMLKDGQLKVSNICDYDVYRWKEGLICFTNLNFVDLMKRIEKYYGINLVIENPSLAKHSFSGKFRISDGIENLLRVLQKDVSYRYTRSEDGNVIYIK